MKKQFMIKPSAWVNRLLIVCSLFFAVLFTAKAQLPTAISCPAGDKPTAIRTPNAGWTATSNGNNEFPAFTNPNNVIDGNLGTGWASNSTPALSAANPKRITIDFGSQRSVAGLMMVPRFGAQVANHGFIYDYQIHVSNDNINWVQAATGTWSYLPINGTPSVGAPRAALFNGNYYNARYIRLSATSGSDAFISLVELSIFECSRQAAQITIGCDNYNLLNSGTNVAGSGKKASDFWDNNWDVAYVNGGLPASPINPTLANITNWKPAIISGRVSTAWATSPFNNAEWISATLTSLDIDQRGGATAYDATDDGLNDYFFRYRFNLNDPYQLAVFRLQMDFMSDNSVYNVYVNNISQMGKVSGLPQNPINVYQGGGFLSGQQAKMVLPYDWHMGENELIIHVKSQPGYAGFLAQNVTFCAGIDFGDAPSTYGITKAQFGPGHIIKSDNDGNILLKMGNLLDAEPDGVSSASATQDDVTGLADEDGVTFLPICAGTSTITASVNVYNTNTPGAKVYGWIDLNQNGVFEATEAATPVTAGVAGNYLLTWTNISPLAAGTTLTSRFRLTSDPNISVNTPNNPAIDGEVEDHQVIVRPLVTLTADVTSQMVCAGSPVTINYTPSESVQVHWVRMPGNISGFGNVNDILTTQTTSAPTTYTYTAQTSGGICASNVVVTTITVNPIPIVTPSTCSQTICSGEAGNITFVSSIPGSTINWLRVEDNLAGTGDISEVMNTAGNFTYKIWATSPAPASCPSSTTITCQVVVNPGLNVTARVAGSTCIGDPISLSANVVPTGSYTYAWTGPNGFVSTSANPLVSTTSALIHNGTYTVTVTNAQGCPGTAVVPISVSACCPPPEPIATVSLCNNETLNLQTYVPSGGSFTVLTGTAGALSGSTFNGILSGAGVFKVGYRVAGLGTTCAPDTITVVVRDCTPPACNYPINAIVVDASCGNSDGRAELALGGASANAMTSFAWSNGQVGSAISGLAAGVYSVTATVTDGARVCNVIDSVQVNNIGGPVANLRLVTAASCSVNGAASLSLVSGTGPFTVSWTGAATGSQTAVNVGVVNITNLPVGAYVFRISSAATPGCYGYLSVNIPRKDDAQITLTATATDASNCTSPSGRIVINVQPQVGVSAPFSYSLNGQLLGSSNLPTYTINNLPAGVYTVSAGSASGCTTASIPIIINAIGVPEIAGWTAIDPACPTDQGKLVFAGGQSGTTFQVREVITGAVIASNISGASSTTLVLSAGTYITQTTSASCASADTLILSRPQEIHFNVQYTAETCADGGVGNSDGTLSIVQITGGTAPYTIVVRNDQGQTFTGAQLTSLPAGNYSVNVTDSKGCSGGDGTLVTVPPCGIVCPNLDFNTVVLDAQCGKSNGEATAQLLNTPAGTTVTYTWSNNFIGNTTSGLTSGIYSVTAQITSNDIYNGCKYVETVNVNAIGGPVFTVTPVSPASCTSANGTAVINLLSGTAPLNVSWTGPTTGSQVVPNLGSTTINNLKAGKYVFTVTGSGSTSACQGIYEVTILGNSGNLAATATTSAVTGCGASDGQIFVNVTGGVGPFTYMVNGFVRGFTSSRTFSIQGLPAGTYYIEVTDRNGCTTVRNNVLLNSNGQPPIAGVTSINPLCPAENGTIAYAGTGNATDQYTITVAGTATQIGQTAGNVAATYSVPGGTYLISRTTLTGCVSVTTVTVTQPAGLDYNIQYALPTCEAPTSGSLAVVQANGGTAPYSVTITGASGVVSDLTALTSGSYTVTLGDARGCTLSKVVSLTISGCCNLEATLAAQPVSNCENLADGSLQIEYSGSQTYEYNLNGGAFQPLGTSPFSVTGLAGGSYSVVVQAVGDPTCTTVLTGIIVTPTAPVVATVVVQNSTSCESNDGSVLVVLANGGTGNFEYSINNGTSWQTGNVFAGLAPGNYPILVRNADAISCTVSAGSYTIQAPNGIVASIGGQNQDVCAQNECTITITASGGTGSYEYSLDGGLTFAPLTPNPYTITNLAPMNYAVVVRDAVNQTCRTQKMVRLASEECPVPIPSAPARE